MSDEEPTAEGATSDRIGMRLRAAREARGLSLEDVARVTRVPTRHLEAIETGHHENLPSPTYTAGFVKAYARQVGLDGQESADAFRAEAGGTDPVRRQQASYEPADPARTPPRWLALLGVLVALVVGLAYLYWRGSTEQPAQLAAQGSDRPAAAAPAPAPAPVTPTAPPVATTGPVVVTADQDVWVKIYDEGGATLFMGILKAGQRFAVPAGAIDPRLTTGRPGVTRVTVGDRLVPTLGDPDRAAKAVSLKPDALLARIMAAPAAQPPAGAPAPVENSAGPA